MENIYIAELIFFSLLLFIPRMIERLCYNKLPPREKMIVDFTKYHSYNYWPIAVFILAAIIIHLYPAYLFLCMGIFICSAFIFYIYKHIWAYLIFKREHFPTNYLYITILQPFILLIAVLALTAVIYFLEFPLKSA